MKVRIGRPPLPSGAAKGVVFTLRLTEDERDLLAAAAKRAKTPVTQWARATLVAAATVA